jgi:hypothetical protein
MLHAAMSYDNTSLDKNIRIYVVMDSGVGDQHVDATTMKDRISDSTTVKFNFLEVKDAGDGSIEEWKPLNAAHELRRIGFRHNPDMNLGDAIVLKRMVTLPLGTFINSFETARASLRNKKNEISNPEEYRKLSHHIAELQSYQTLIAVGEYTPYLTPDMSSDEVFHNETWV